MYVWLLLLERQPTNQGQIGLALRMALSLGLHQEVSDPGISETDRNHRRQAWWSVYSLDRYDLPKPSADALTLISLEQAALCQIRKSYYYPR